MYTLSINITIMFKEMCFKMFNILLFNVHAWHTPFFCHDISTIFFLRSSQNIFLLQNEKYFNYFLTRSSFSCQYVPTYIYTNGRFLNTHTNTRTIYTNIINLLFRFYYGRLKCEYIYYI